MGTLYFYLDANDLLARTMLMLHPEYRRQEESGPRESGTFGEVLFEGCCCAEIRFAYSSL